jgi:hypothetical protein
LHGPLIEDWNSLQLLLEIVEFDSTKNDSIKWTLDKTQTFTTKSLYQLLTHGGVRDRLCTLVWKCKVPLQVKVFLWQMIHNKLQTATTLKRRGWHGSPLCCVCDRPETVDHIMFQCVFQQYLWCCVRDPLD